MRRYDDAVEVRRGPVPGPGGTETDGPEQFLWRGRLWKVCSVLAWWVETEPWWRSAAVAAVLGTDGAAASGGGGGIAVVPDLVGERERWRVVAGVRPGPGGVFDLCLDWADGSWRLVGCED